MRIISGKYRHRIIQGVPGEQTRETKDRVKESIFNSVGSVLPQTIVLDLFAGSGSLGLEALSRGARFVDFVDRLPQAAQVIQQNLMDLGALADAKITVSDAIQFVNNTNQTYDIILVDPPYAMDIIDEIIEIIGTRKLLNEFGIIITLYQKNKPIKPQNCGIMETKKKTIGITNVSYLKWGNEL